MFVVIRIGWGQAPRKPCIEGFFGFLTWFLGPKSIPGANVVGVSMRNRLPRHGHMRDRSLVGEGIDFGGWRNGLASMTE